MNWNNKKNVCIQATVALILLFSAGVSAIHPTNSSTSTTFKDVESTFIHGDTSAITMTVVPPNIVYGQSTLAGRNFATLELSGEGFTTVIGEARLPTLSRFIEIPQGANPELIVESISWQTTSLAALHLPSSIIPVQPSLIKIEGASVEFTLDNTFYAMNTFLPTTIADIHVIGELRGRNIALLEISPVQYNPVSGELKIMTKCELRINLPGSDLIKTTEKVDRYTTPSFEQMFNTLLINSGSLQVTGKGEPKQEGYLIIVADDFYNAIQPFADWKSAKGFDVTITKTSEIPSGPTKENIKAYIVNAYNTWPTPPTYVLLVGDVAQIPTWTGSATGTCTDLYYVTIDSGNYFADVIISRFPAATADQVTAMVDKTIYYETGSFTNTSWIKKAVFMASSDNHLVSEGTHNYVIDTYMTPHNYACDKLYSYYGATTAQTSAAINNGRSLAIYSGHGSETSWADGPPYSQSNINALTNDGIYPFVCSHACLTCQFTVSECFGETWLRASHKGGLAFWGATDYSYWDEDDILERNTFKAWWDDGIETIGGMTNMGLFYLYQYYGGSGMSQYYFEEYNVLGDSSVKIWRDQPNPSMPPNTPNEPSGSTTGLIEIEYTFTATTTDPEGDNISFKFNWGDGNFSDWIGPYSSGGIVNAKHSWAALGTYQVKVKAKDTSGGESGWSVGHTISIVDAPIIRVVWIMGGLHVSTLIKNDGGVTANNVNWSISLDGNVFIGKKTTGQIASLGPGEQQVISSKFIFGLGSTVITVSAAIPQNADVKTQDGKVFLFYIKV
jgi:Peptidase family C25/Propeptide_C25/PKD domain